MNSKSISTILLLVFSSALIFIVVYFEMATIATIYWLIPAWGIILLLGFKLWDISKRKIIVLIHTMVLLCGTFSFLTYQLYKKLISTTPIQSPNFTSVSNLLFNSENALYLMIYSGFLILLFDTIYIIKHRKI